MSHIKNILVKLNLTCKNRDNCMYICWVFLVRRLFTFPVKVSSSDEKEEAMRNNKLILSCSNNYTLMLILPFDLSQLQI